MKKFLIKISSILMSLLMVMSTMSFSISEHYCGGELVNSSIFTIAKPCSLDMEKSSLNEDCTIQKDNCCKDLVIQIKGQDELITFVGDLNFDQQVFIASFVFSYINLFEGLDSKVAPFQNYSPPLGDNDFQVLLQTFLI